MFNYLKVTIVFLLIFVVSEDKLSTSSMVIELRLTSNVSESSSICYIVISMMTIGVRSESKIYEQDKHQGRVHASMT